MKRKARLQEQLDAFLTFLGVLVLPALVVDDIGGGAAQAVAATLDWIIWIGFAVALGLLFLLSPHPRAFWRTYWSDILIVGLTPPIVPDGFQALRALRMLRLLRLLLIAFRLNRYAHRLKRTTVVGPAAVLLIVVIVSAATAVHLLEPTEVPNEGAGLWWAISRATAMGSAGITLSEPVSRVLEVVVALSGLSFLSLITAAVATIFVHAQGPSDQIIAKLEEIIARVQNLEDQLTASRSDLGVDPQQLVDEAVEASFAKN